MREKMGERVLLASRNPFLPKPSYCVMVDGLARGELRTRRWVYLLLIGGCCELRCCCPLTCFPSMISSHGGALA